MLILKVISLLMDYPTEALQRGRQELVQAIVAATVLGRVQQQSLAALLDQLVQADLLDAQEAYTELFERGRFLSLLLFEHVHGESRDRGQAMVDLLAQYEAAGFSLDVKELPDYIPLYLEYLSTCDEATARAGLADIQHLLALLAARLEERGSAYAACFHALLQLAGAEPQGAVALQRAQAVDELADDSLEALDALWAEETVTFLNGEQGACPSAVSVPARARQEQSVPVHWVDFKQPVVAKS